MATFPKSIHIAAPPAAVWAVAGDRFPDLSWLPTVAASKMVGGAAPGVGAVREVTLPKGAKVPRLLERLIEWDEGRGFTYEIRELPAGLKEWVNTWRFDAEGEGTKVTYTTRLRTSGGPLAPLVTKLAWKGQVEKTVEGILRALKAEVERRDAAPPRVAVPTT